MYPFYVTILHIGQRPFLSVDFIKKRFNLSHLNASLILLCAGGSTRFGLKAKKQWLRIDDMPLWLFVASRLSQIGFKKIVVVGAPDELSYMRKFATYEFVSGGESRQESLNNALSVIDTEWVFSHDVARVCTPNELFFELFSAKDNFECVVPAIKAQDTTLLDGENLDREKLSLIQTPQLSKTELLKKALAQGIEYTDDSTAIKAVNGKVKLVNGDKKAHKLTTLDDLSRMSCLKAPSKEQFIGFGT
ncbi:MAG: bifunctional 2-C-methyl-D-erythritol 4-phosphate cytidylyltransferase / 2-C-methyl-D-erythritol, partial [Pseudomonadota bacterium]